MRLFHRQPQLSLEDTAPYARTPDVEPFPEIPTDYLPDNVTVHFHFAPHIERRHLEGALPILEQADIFLPENAGWDLRTRRMFMAISRGDERRYREMRDNPFEYPEYTRGLMDAIYRRGRYIDFFDKKEGEDVIDELEQDLLPPFATIEEALQRLANNASNLVFSEGFRRDRIMAQNLGDVVTRIVSANKPLRRKPNVLALATLGSGHMPLFDYLRTQEATEGKVTASQWAGDGITSPYTKIYEIYAKSGTPTRAELLAAIVQHALVQTVINMSDGTRSRVLPRKAMGNPNPSEADLIGIRIFERINGDIGSPRTQQFVLDLLNGNHSAQTAYQIHKLRKSVAIL